MRDEMTCGEAQRMGRSYCTRPKGHHGLCVTDAGRRYHQTILAHPDGCEGCEPEFAEVERENRRRHPLRFAGMR